MSTASLAHEHEADWSLLTVGAPIPADYYPLTFNYRNWNDGTHGQAWFEVDGVLHLDGLTVEQCAQMFVNTTIESAKREQQKYAFSQSLELCSLGYISLFVLRALCGHYPSDEQTALFWETVRAMMREDAAFDVPTK